MQRQRCLSGSLLQATGFTILELLITCTISVILALLSSYVLRFVYITKLNLAVTNLTSIVQSARSLALTHKSPVIICPSTNQLSCAESWANSAIIFIDANKNKTQDAEEESIALIELPKDVGTLKWVAFGGKTNLTFTNDGFTDNQNGRFYICPAKPEKRYLRQLIIHKSGRPRTASPQELKFKYCGNLI